MEKITVILAIGLLNYLMRSLPFLLFGEKHFPQTLQRWLEYVPVAVLCAILAPMLLLPEGIFELSTKNLMLIAAIPTFVIAIVTRNMGLILALGVVIMAIVQNYLGT